MINATGVISKYVLVHDGEKVIVKQYNKNQETVTTKNLETFDTEQEMEDRIIELGLVDLVDEEV